jgi:hypothetical protein
LNPKPKDEVAMKLALLRRRLSLALYLNYIHGAKSMLNKKTRKTLLATNFIANVLFLILCSGSLAAEPKTMAFLEEHNVAPGTPQTIGALYIVPPGRKAFISNMFCEIRSFNDPGYSQILLMVVADTTLTGPATSTGGMNPLDCVNSGYFNSKTSSAGFTLLPGNFLYAVYANFGHSIDFQMLSAFIFEEDL